MHLTTRRKLKKPDRNDRINIADINYNADILDNIKDQAVITVGHVDYLLKHPIQVDYVCQGHDDEEPIQAAINFINSIGGGTVRVLPGSYIIHNNLVMKSNVSLIMESGAVIKLMNQIRTPLTSDLSWDAFTFTVANPDGFKAGMRIGLSTTGAVGYTTGYYGTIDTVVGNTITLKNDGICPRTSGENLTTAAGATMLSFFSAFVTDWTDVDVDTNNWSIVGGELDGNKASNPTWLINKDRGHNGINFFSFNNVTIKDMVIHDFQFQGIHPIGRTSRNLIIENCNIYNCWAGICMDSCDDGPSMLINLRCCDNTTAGIQLVDVNYAVVMGGYFKNNKWGVFAGYWAGTCSYVKIIGATCIGRMKSGDSSTAAGIILDNMDNAIIEGCYISNAQNGVYLFHEGEHTSHHNTINDCTITGCDAAIRESANSHHNRANNIFLDGTCTTDFVLSSAYSSYSYTKDGITYNNGQSVSFKSVNSADVVVGTVANKDKAHFVCDGAGDNVEIQAAIDLANSLGGGTVRILPGVYTIHNCIVPKENVHIEMEHNSVIKVRNQLRTALTSDLAWNAYTFTVQNATGFEVGMRCALTTTSATGYITGYHARIQSIDGNTITVYEASVSSSPDRVSGENLAVSAGATLVSYFSAFRGESYTDNWSISGGEIDGNSANVPVWIINKDSGGNGMIIGSGYDITIDRMHIHHTRFQGLHTCGRDVRGLVISNCYVHDTNSSGISVDSVDDPVMVINCTSNNNSADGLQLVDVDYATVIGGHYENNKRGIGIEFAGGVNSFNKIIGATCIGRMKSGDAATAAGITLDNAAHTVVDGCYISNAQNGINFYNEGDYHSEYNLVSNCVITECTNAVNETSVCHNNAVDNIVLDGTCTNSIVYAGQSSVYSYVLNGIKYSNDPNIVTINVQTLSANLTLTKASNQYQYLNCNGANRIISLPTDVGTGKTFVIKNNSSYDAVYYLDIQFNGTSFDQVYAGRIVSMIYNGTTWVNAENGTGENDSRKNNIGLGWKALCYNNGVALGSNSLGYTSGVSIGLNSAGYNYGVAVGRGTEGNNYGTALGYGAATTMKQLQVALGAYSKAERFNEVAHTMDASTTNKNNASITGWKSTTTNATQTELFLNGTSERFRIIASSVVAFEILVTARDNTTGDCACYKFIGAIKRDGSNNTALVGTVTKTVIAANNSSWDADVLADDTNEALIIKVTGDAINAVQWVARADTIETRF